MNFTPKNQIETQKEERETDSKQCEYFKSANIRNYSISQVDRKSNSLTPEREAVEQQIKEEQLNADAILIQETAEIDISGHDLTNEKFLSNEEQQKNSQIRKAQLLERIRTNFYQSWKQGGSINSKNIPKEVGNKRMQIKELLSSNPRGSYEQIRKLVNFKSKYLKILKGNNPNQTQITQLFDTHQSHKKLVSHTKFQPVVSQTKLIAGELEENDEFISFQDEKFTNSQKQKIDQSFTMKNIINTETTNDYIKEEEDYEMLQNYHKYFNQKLPLSLNEQSNTLKINTNSMQQSQQKQLLQTQMTLPLINSRGPTSKSNFKTEEKSNLTDMLSQRPAKNNFQSKGQIEVFHSNTQQKTSQTDNSHHCSLNLIKHNLLKISHSKADVLPSQIFGPLQTINSCICSTKRYMLTNTSTEEDFQNICENDNITRDQHCTSNLTWVKQQEIANNCQITLQYPMKNDKIKQLFATVKNKHIHRNNDQNKRNNNQNCQLQKNGFQNSLILQQNNPSLVTQPYSPSSYFNLNYSGPSGKISNTIHSALMESILKKKIQTTRN